MPLRKTGKYKEIMESRVQLLETTVQRLEEELVEKTARLNKMYHEMKEDIFIFKNILKEHREPAEILSDSSDNAWNRKALVKRRRIVIHDRKNSLWLIESRMPSNERKVWKDQRTSIFPTQRHLSELVVDRISSFIQSFSQ